ncbi:uncharacterized protein LOC117797250 [Ailuropoda melanoleuca]|uniref:uncharacterized protein LOC117797250 n=1 Tax=Ailuropoda melanoleuca TaxID=9646 RepID=UPI0014941EC9|nr:uncharacterized protein LOC117797250 [Ailuropoda melanoleuca]
MMLFGLPGCSNNTPAALPLRPERPGPPRYSSGPFTPGAPPPRGRVTARAEQSGGSTRRASRLLHRNNTRTWGHSPGTRRCRRGGRGAGETAPLPPHPRWCRRVQLPPPPGPAGGAAPPFPARPGTRGDLWFFLRGGLPKAFRNPADFFHVAFTLKSGKKTSTVSFLRIRGKREARRSILGRNIHVREGRTDFCGCHLPGKHPFLGLPGNMNLTWTPLPFLLEQTSSPQACLSPHSRQTTPSHGSLEDTTDPGM